MNAKVTECTRAARSEHKLDILETVPMHLQLHPPRDLEVGQGAPYRVAKTHMP